jgi:hypothetical protein
VDGLKRTKLCVRVGGLFVDGVFDGLVVGLHGDFVLASAALVVVVLNFAGGDVLGAHSVGGGCELVWFCWRLFCWRKVALFELVGRAGDEMD